jgi:hypothetical protein
MSGETCIGIRDFRNKRLVSMWEQQRVLTVIFARAPDGVRNAEPAQCAGSINLPCCDGMSACAAPATLVASARYRTAGSLPDQGNLQVGGAVLLRIEAAAVDIARTPEQQIAPKIDEVVFHEIRSFLETEGEERLPEDALG